MSNSSRFTGFNFQISSFFFNFRYLNRCWIICLLTVCKSRVRNFLDSFSFIFLFSFSFCCLVAEKVEETDGWKGNFCSREVYLLRFSLFPVKENFARRRWYVSLILGDEIVGSVSNSIVCVFLFLRFLSGQTGNKLIVRRRFSNWRSNRLLLFLSPSFIFLVAKQVLSWLQKLSAVI